MEAPNITIGRQGPRKDDGTGPSDALSGAGTAGDIHHSDIGISGGPAMRVADEATAAEHAASVKKGWTDKLRAWIRGDDILRMAPPWTAWPDYNQVENVNALIAGLWPHIAEAAEGMVRDMVPQILSDSAKQYGAGHLVGLELVQFKLGDTPPRVAAMKTYEASNDEQLFMEAPISWGSDLAVTLAASLKLPGIGSPVRIPVTVRNVQVKAHARVTARPLMEDPPYVGSVSMTLMSPPHIDFELPVALPGMVWPGAGSKATPFDLDLMALPLVRGVFRAAVHMVAQRLLVYPRCFQYELIPGGSCPPGPVGMVSVRLVRIQGLRSEDLIGQSDPYVVVQVREGRSLRSRTKSNENNPVFDESFVLLVDNPARQRLRIVAKDDDFGWGDKVLGVAEVPLAEAAFMQAPHTTVPLALTLKKLSQPPGRGVLSVPMHLLGLPVSAAAAGGRAIANATGVGSGIGKRGGQGGAPPGAGGPAVNEAGAGAGAESGAGGGGKVKEGRAARSGYGGSYSEGERSDGEGSEAGSDVTGRRGRSPTGPGGARARARSEEREEGGEKLPRSSWDGPSAYLGPGPHFGGAPGPVAEAPAGDAAAGDSGDKAGDTGDAGKKAIAKQQAEEEGPGSSAAAAAKTQEKGGEVTEENRGTVFLEVRYIPFRAGREGPGHVGTGLTAGAGGSVSRLGSAGSRTVSPSDKGVLTVTLVRAMALGGWTGEPDPYVELTLYGAGASPNAVTGDKGGLSAAQHKQVSSTVWNEANPRWNEKFDFVMVPAGAVLLATVKDRTSTFEKIASFKLTDRFKSQTLGRVKVPLMEVAAAGRLRGSWPLQGALEGQLDMVLEWIDAAVADLPAR